jgi:hypothetical protein
MEKWRKIMEGYAFRIQNNSFLTAYSGEHPLTGQKGYGLELEDVESERLSAAMFSPQTDKLDELKNPKELLNYRAIIVEAEGLPEDTKRGLVRLLQKIEEL